MAYAARFATQLVGSWSKPKWLCNHDMFFAPENTWWRVPAEQLGEAQDDATLLAIRDQEQAGLTYVTDGEQRRQTFSGYFNVLGGIDSVNRTPYQVQMGDIGNALTMKSRPTLATASDVKAPMFTIPTVTGPITWDRPLVGADLIQLDEPEAHFRFSVVKDFAIEAINRAVHGIKVPTAVHVCYGYSKNIAAKRINPVYENSIRLLAATDVTDISLEYEQPGHIPELLTQAGSKNIILGLLNLDTEAPVESVDHIVTRAKAALQVISPDRLRLAPDCGMWFLPRARALGKISALAAAAAQLRG
jgi:methionine synthase II (cobalamin-independent)